MNGIGIGTMLNLFAIEILFLGLEFDIPFVVAEHSGKAQQFVIPLASFEVERMGSTQLVMLV
jgi:hypothetical protein